MGKILKYILGLVVLLVVAAVVVLPMVIDPNDYKDEIAAAVEKQTGRTLTIDGDIKLSVFPWLGLDIGPTQFSNAPGFDEPAMARMQAVQVRAKLLPLLKKQLEVGKVQLSGLQLYLAKDKQGRTNWDDLTGGEAEEKPQDRKQEKSATGEGLQQLAIGGIEITDARIQWDDLSTDSHYTINDLSLTTGDITPGEPFDLDFQLQLASTKPPVNTGLALNGEVLVAADLSVISVTAAKLQVDATGESLPGGRLAASLKTDISVGLDAGTLQLPNLVLEALGMTMSGSVSGTGINADDPRFSGSLAIAEFAPRDVLQALGQEPPVTADSGALGKASANLDWDASTQHFAASALTAHLDETTINGDLKVASFDAPAISFKLALDQIDLDRYLPPESAAGDEANKAAAARGDGPAGTPQNGKASASSQDLPLEPLRQLDLNGDISIGQLKAFKLRSRDVVIRVRAKDGMLKVSPLTAKLYEGGIDMALQLDVRKDTPQVSVKETLTGVQAGPLLKDMTGNDPILGKTTVKADLSGTGASTDEILRTLTGTANFAFKEGAINGVNIAALIRSAQAKIEGKPAPSQTEPNRTDFAVLKGSAKIKNGLVRNDDLVMKSPLLRISGKGKASLPEETIDYTLTTKFVGSLEGQGGKGNKKLQGVAVPVHVAGTFSDPSYTPDLGAVMSDAARAEVDKRVEKEKKKLQKKLGKDVPDDLLKGLFKK